ncbi:MAG: (d)CMP kinase [Anaerolineaceae bacterium]|nr:(d)CMP kinase [Anaerolineaceae bacterium]
MKQPNLIAIDGPAASGKSTVAEILANELNYMFFDTGVMYRAVTLIALNQISDLDMEHEVVAIADSIEIDVRKPSKGDGRKYDVWVNGKDITWEIRQPAVDANVSKVSAYAGVRTAMTSQQRRIGMKSNVVMVGRDIGTVVLPEADLKVYLDASAEERAKRRHAEIISRGDEADYEKILESMIRRDKIDSTRAVAPLKPADDAVIIHSDHLCVAEVVHKIKDLFAT